MADKTISRWTCQRDLGYGYGEYDYNVRIEYPELQKMNDDMVSESALRNYDIQDWPDIEWSLCVSSKRGILDVSMLPVVKRSGDYYRVLSFKLVVDSIPRRYDGLKSSADSSERYSSHSVLSQGHWVRIKVTDSGVYRLTDSFLRKVGFTDPGKVRLYGYGGSLLPTTGLQNLSDDLTEIPLWREDGFSLFYGQGVLSWTMDYKGNYSHCWNTYSDYGSYFLTDGGDGDPMSVPEVETMSVISDTIVTYPDYLLYEVDDYSWMHSGAEFYDSYDFEGGNTKNYSFQIDGLTADSVMMTVRFAAAGSESSTLRSVVNSQQAGNMPISALSSYSNATVSSQTYVCRNMFQDGSNTVTLIHQRSPGISGHLDYIRLNFTRSLALRGAETLFRTGNRNGTHRFGISGASTGTVVWRIAPGGGLSVLPSEVKDGLCVTEPVSFASGMEYVALNVNGAFPEPEFAGDVPNQDLHGTGHTDMVIIVPSSGTLVPSADRLAEWHAKNDGLDVLVVTAAQVYNEFSSGTPDATAYRRLMKMLYDRADVDSLPRYLLLLGDGSWDNRMVTSDWRGTDPDDYLLCFESQNSVSQTRSYVMEDYFGLLDDSEGRSLLTEKADIGIGRIPVVTATQADGVIDKIIAYASGQSAGEWQNRLVLLGDDGDNNTHMEDAEEVAAIWSDRYKELLLKKIYWDNYKMEVNASGNSYPAVRKLLLEQLEEGALVVNYVGHGSADVLSHELVLNKNDMKELVSPRVPLWITASCDIGPFDSSSESIGENMVTNPVGGAIGTLTTTRTVYSSLNSVINQLFSDYVLSSDSCGRPYTLGDALRLSKAELVSSSSSLQDMTENKLHYVLLGDPALKLNVARRSLIADSIDGMPVDGNLPHLKAGQVITVSGHVESVAGGVDESFNGVLYATVLDSERTITTLNNAGAADEAFTYTDRDRLLFSGSDSVRRGYFTFRFPVPLDINYSDESGLLDMYALASDAVTAANGYTDRFLIGGTTDSLNVEVDGPEISVYLNYPGFEYWGQVNETPCFVADIQDDAGINTSGNGIGHNLTLIIDNSPIYTYNLNSYYRTVVGDFTRGRVLFTLPALPAGRHSLLFRAWNVMNVSSTVQLGFEVVEGLKPSVTVTAVDNPTRGPVQIVVSHDRPGSSRQIRLTVSDLSGRQLWETSFTESAAESVSVIEWNLTSNSTPVTPGLYIIKVWVTDSAGGTSTATDKLIVL